MAVAAIAELDFELEQSRSERLANEHHNRSLRTCRPVGHLAIKGALESAEGQDAIHAYWQEQLSVVGEMLKTDPELKHLVEISRLDYYQVKDNQVLAYDNKTPVVEICEDGYHKSLAEAKHDPRMWTQVARNGNDVPNAQIVDEMVAGKTGYNTRILVTPDPKEAMARDGFEYWEKQRGYQRDLAYVQLYNAAGESLLAGSFSVDYCDLATWRDVFTEFGIAIPADETSDNYLRYAITAELDSESAVALVESIRARYYELVGQASVRKPVEAILADHEDKLWAMFETLNLPLSESLARRRKAEAIDMFVEEILQANPTNLSAEIKSELIRVYNRDAFDEQSARTIAQVINYAMTEVIRGKVWNKKDNLAAQSLQIQNWQQLDSRQIIAFMGGGFIAGVEAGRSYIACGGLMQMLERNNFENSQQIDNPQEAFGGKTCPEVKDGQIVKCPDCKQKVRAIVPHKEKIYCSNPKCKLAAPDIAAK